MEYLFMIASLIITASEMVGKDKDEMFLGAMKLLVDFAIIIWMLCKNGKKN